MMKSDKLRCPWCRQQAAASVVETEKTQFCIRRRRECSACGRRFTTREYPPAVKPRS